MRAFASTLLLASLACADAAAQPGAVDPDTAATCSPDPDGPPLRPRDFPASSYSAYVLPFRPGTTHLVWRSTSHHNPGNRGVGLYAVDLGMPVGTPIVASRAGQVVAVQARFADGNDTDLQENYVMIRHADKTVARTSTCGKTACAFASAIASNKAR